MDWEMIPALDFLRDRFWLPDWLLDKTMWSGGGFTSENALDPEYRPIPIADRARVRFMLLSFVGTANSDAVDWQRSFSTVPTTASLVKEIMELLSGESIVTSSYFKWNVERIFHVRNELFRRENKVLQVRKWNGKRIEIERTYEEKSHFAKIWSYWQEWFQPWECLQGWSLWCDSSRSLTELPVQCWSSTHTNHQFYLPIGVLASHRWKWQQRRPLHRNRFPPRHSVVSSAHQIRHNSKLVLLVEQVLLSSHSKLELVGKEEQTKKHPLQIHRQRFLNFFVSGHQFIC